MFIILMVFISVAHAGDATKFRDDDRIELSWNRTYAHHFFGQFDGHAPATAASRYGLILDLCLPTERGPSCKTLTQIDSQSIPKSTDRKLNLRKSVMGKTVRDTAQELLKRSSIFTDREQFVFLARFNLDGIRDLATSEIRFTSDRSTPERAGFRVEYQHYADWAYLEGSVSILPKK